ncbi:MAG: toxin ParE1/3/4 [Arcticibacterium sp.]|jgi:toxin ParE1/3/4
MAKYESILDPLAELDIDEGLDYYSIISQDLALRFIDDIEQKLGLKSTTPKAFQIRYSRYHTIPLKVFPFMIHYYIDEKIKQFTF